MKLMIIVALAALGLIFGSFINALVWRLHTQSLPKSKRPKKVNLSMTRGRSVCVDCHHELAWYDLIPVFSWVLLRGKCRYCHKPIHWQYPVVELLTAVIFVLSGIFWPLESTGVHEWLPLLNLAGWLVVVVGMVALVIYDFRWMLLPNRIVYPLTILALLLTALNVGLGGGKEVLFGTLFGVAIAGGLFFVLFYVSNGKWIGGGDVKLGFLSGLLLADPYLAFLMLFTASTLGTFAVIPAMISGRLKTSSRVPFGPFLAVATIVVKLFGQVLIDWYKNWLGL